MSKRKREDGYYWVQYMGKWIIAEWFNSGPSGGEFKMLPNGKKEFEHYFECINESMIVLGGNISIVDEINAKVKQKKHNTTLTIDILEKLKFKNVEENKFENFEMSYWVKNGICLFYNTPINTDYQDSFYVGYAEMRQGKYHVTAFRWIDNLEELTKVYEIITQKLITE